MKLLCFFLVVIVSVVDVRTTVIFVCVAIVEVSTGTASFALCFIDTRTHVIFCPMFVVLGIEFKSSLEK